MRAEFRVSLENFVEKCLNPEKGRKKGLFKVRPSMAEAQEFLDKAQWNLQAMKINYDNHLYDWSIVIGYYAMYHATLSALRLVGLDAKRHDCAAAALDFFFCGKGGLVEQNLKSFEKAKKLEKSFVETLNKASVERVQVQYGVVKAKAKDAEWMVKSAAEFVEAIEDVLLEAKGIKIRRL